VVLRKHRLSISAYIHVYSRNIVHREESIKGIKSGTGKGIPKPLKPKSKEEVTEVTNDRYMEKINTRHK